MKTLVDANFVIALANRRDQNHAKAVTLARTKQFDYYLPSVIIPEVTHLIRGRVSHTAMRNVVRQLLNPMWHHVPIDYVDIERADAILIEYADAQLDFVDCALVAIAERLAIDTVLTFDRRDFSIIRPKHVPYFNILPN